MSLASSSIPLALVARAVGQTGIRSCRTIYLSSRSQSPSQQKHAASALESSTSHSSSESPASSSASSEAGPSRARGTLTTAPRKQTRRPGRSRTNPQPALARLDPRHPLLPSLTPPSASARKHVDQNLSQRRAKKLSQLHVALQTGSADAVWAAYLELRPHRQEANSPSFQIGQAVPDNILTPEECRDVLRLISNNTTKTRRGMHRVLRIISDVRCQQRHLLTRLESLSERRDAARRRILDREIEAWDSVVSSKLLNETIGHIGKSFRSVGLDEIDQVLDQLLTYEANELGRANTSSHSTESGKHHSTSHATDTISSLRNAMLSPAAQSALKKKSGIRRPQQDFPTLVTYNIILDIITRTVHRSNPSRRSSAQDENTHDDDEEDAMAKFTEQHLESRSAQLNASLATKLRRFDLDPEAAPLHLDALERADRLFHSVLQRMQRSSRINPDPITFNIMITMYCLLDRWEAVHRVIRVMRDQGVLKIDCINNALGHWLVHGPTSVKRRLGGDDVESTAVDSALEVYGQLRENLVQFELASRHSAIAYGKRDPYSQATLGKDEDQRDSEQEAGPLTWPDRNESASTDAVHRASVASSSSPGVEEALGIPSLPPDLVPDEITYALIIRSLTWEGRFADALSVFRDLVSTPVRPSAGATAAYDQTGDKRMQPTLAIFDSFFRGFSRHGRPSTPITFDGEHPERSTWELVPMAAAEEDEAASERSSSLPQPTQDGPHAQQMQLWRIETFQQIFDAFLDFEPDVDRVLSTGASGKKVDRSRESAQRRVSTPLGWLTLAEKRTLDALQQAPSTNQLFWILTAIRRVSHDHAAWSLAMWHKVVDKFDANSASSSGKLAWHGFRLDNRLRRVLEHLESRLAEEQRQADQQSSTEDERDA